MPADPAAPVTEPRAELVEAVCAQTVEGWHVGHPEGDWHRTEAACLLIAVLPKLTLADLPAALLDEHEQQIRADERRKCAAEVAGSTPYNSELRPDGSEDPLAAAYVEGLHDAWATILHPLNKAAARGTEGGTR